MKGHTKPRAAWSVGPVIDHLQAADHPLLMTATFAIALDRPTRSAGLHRMRGLDEPEEVFALEGTDPGYRANGVRP